MDEQSIMIPCTIHGCEEIREFTPGEQKFYKAKGFQQPKYCKKHSDERRKRHEDRDRAQDGSENFRGV